MQSVRKDKHRDGERRNTSAQAEDREEKEIRACQVKLNEITTKKTQYLIKKLRLQHFNHNNKSGKFLANQIKQNKEKNTISVIKDSAGKPSTSPEEINNIFRMFFQKLYTPEINPNEVDIHTFLNSIDLPTLSKNQVTQMDSPINENEL